MASRGPRVVAELGRPETPDETAARKAESSRVYRSSQTVRNLVAALIATLAVVLVIVFAVPRGEPAPREPLDVAAVAQQVESARGAEPIVPTVPADWSVNGASVDEDDAWTIVYAPPGDSGFLRFAQAFENDQTWAMKLLRGTDPSGTTRIGDIVWDRYEIADPSTTGNIRAALGVQAGADHVLIYGDASEDDLSLVAESVADQVRTLQEAAR